MLASKFRFQGLGSVRAAMNHGSTTRAGIFSIKTLHRPHRHWPRAAIIVSRKTAKKATTRNRIRRRLYEELRKNWGQVKGPIDIVIIAHNAQIADLPSDELAKRFSKALRLALSAVAKQDTPTTSSNGVLK
jgi:ribonuclease P protein component